MNNIIHSSDTQNTSQNIHHLQEMVISFTSLQKLYRSRCENLHHKIKQVKPSRLDGDLPKVGLAHMLGTV